MYIDVSPVAFRLGPFVVAWYGIMVALAIATLVVWALLAVKKGARVSYDTVISAAIVGIVSGIIFSRLLHVIDLWDYYMHNPRLIFSSFGEGLTIYGAVLGAALGIWIYSRIRRISFGYFADMIAPGIILAQAIGRVGCTLNGCCYGVPTDFCLAVIYTSPDTHAPIGIPVHPTQIYELFYNLIVFGVLLLLRRRLRPDGSLFLVYLTLYGAWRLGIDFIREGKELLFGLHEAQLISIVVLVITITLMALKTRWVKKEEIITEAEVGEVPRP